MSVYTLEKLTGIVSLVDLILLLYRLEYRRHFLNTFQSVLNRSKTVCEDTRI
jgi:hypothetical protein